MNTISTEPTRPLSASGVASAEVVERMFTEKRSTKPLSSSASIDSAKLRDSPNTIMQPPNAATVVNRRRPACLVIGRRVR